MKASNIKKRHGDENSSPTKLRGASLYGYAPEEAAHWETDGGSQLIVNDR